MPILSMADWSNGARFAVDGVAIDANATYDHGQLLYYFNYTFTLETRPGFFSISYDAAYLRVHPSFVAI